MDLFVNQLTNLNHKLIITEFNKNKLTNDGLMILFFQQQLDKSEIVIRKFKI